MVSSTRRELLAGAAALGTALGLTTLGFEKSAVAETGVEPAGVRLIRLADGHRVWTRRVGSGPRKVLLLHGGPGLSHDYMECFASVLPQAGFEMYFYDQLGCGRSDHPNDVRLWNLPRYLDEVEQVRAALGIDKMILIGHSWGSILGIEYALRHPHRLERLVLSNMSASFADYGAYVNHLRQTLPADVRQQMATLEAAHAQGGDAYAALMQKELYNRYICRLDPWPEPVLRSLQAMNPSIYNQMQGPDEFTLTGNLKNWDRWADLKRISTPTLVMGARYDEMDPESIRREARLIPGAELFISETGSHMAMWDDQQRYFAALLGFLKAGRSKSLT
jgi:proline iminopeptidase